MIEGLRQTSAAELLHNYCLKLRECGVHVDRSTLGAPILHPIAKSSFVFWDLLEGSSQRWFTYTQDQLELLRASPIYKIYTGGEPSSLRLDNPVDRNRYPIGHDLWGEGYIQYEAIPLKFSDETFKVLTLATKSPNGFARDGKSLIDATLPALTMVYEGLLARNTAKTLMETYVGKRAGLRVLDGEIARGDGSHINAVIWFSDLRGFTSLAQSRTESELLKLLNDYFEIQTDAIETHSGEVLKFIGDAVLAIFSHEEAVGDAVARAEAAAFQAIKESGTVFDHSFGIGLHTGSVFYGNIGGGNRLDFTVIGSSVNLANRIESLCGPLEHPLLVSADFAEQSVLNWVSQGHHKLKGVPNTVEVFSPTLDMD